MAKMASVPLSYWAEREEMYLTPKDAAAVIGCDPYKINVMAKTAEGRQKLGFPLICIGTCVKIPRIPFLRYLGWEGEIKGAIA